MPLSFSLIWKVLTLIFFQWWLHFRSALACCLILSTSTPDTQTPPHPTPFPEAGWTTVSCWCTGFSSYLCVTSSTHFQMPCPLQPVSHVFCTALCVCHVHSVDTSLCSPYLPFSHLHCLSLRPGYTSFSTLPSLLQEDRDVPDFFPSKFQILIALRSIC